jgi:hypothetical protein
VVLRRKFNEKSLIAYSPFTIQCRLLKKFIIVILYCMMKYFMAFYVFLFCNKTKMKIESAIIKNGLFKVGSKTHNSRLFTLSLFILKNRLHSRRGCVTGTPLLLLLSKKYAIAFFRIPTSSVPNQKRRLTRLLVEIRCR